MLMDGNTHVAMIFCNHFATGSCIIIRVMMIAIVMAHWHGVAYLESLPPSAPTLSPMPKESNSTIHEQANKA